MKYTLKNHPTCSKCQFYYSPSFVCPVADKVSTVANPKCPMIDWFIEFEKELREKLAEATKEWDDLGLICADLRRDIFKEILGEASSADEGSGGG